MDYETLHILYRSRQTLIKLLADRGYNTKAYEKFGPVEIAAMAAAATGAAGAGSFRMDLERQTTEPISNCRVVYSINRVKNRLNSFLEETTSEGEPLDPQTTELIVILLEPVVESFHAAALNALAKDKLRVSFFQAHTIVNNPMEHTLQPKFELLPKSQHAEFLKQNKIKSIANLPLIKFHEDMVARIMGLLPGDIVKIIRPSPSAGEYITYRVCSP
jgi:DNA-directed RNA polymerase I, II, and III subunit RPABC1